MKIMRFIHEEKIMNAHRRIFMMVGGALRWGGALGLSIAAGKIKPTDKSVLIVVDVQNCFIPDSSLARAWK